MSWYVDGVRYESYRDYLAAIERRDRQTARSQADELRREAAGLRRRIAARESELDQARGDLQRQTAIQESLRADVGQLRRTQDTLASMQQDLQARTDREFRRLETDLEAARGEIHGVRVDVQELRGAHERHVSQVRETFEEVRGELARGLEEADARLRQTEAQVRREIEAVDAKVESDRHARLARISTDLDRVAEQVRMVEQVLGSHQTELSVLNLGEDAQQIREDLAEAQRLAAARQASSALALGSGALSKARNLEHRIRTRRAELESTRQAYLGQIADLRERLAKDRAPDVLAYFPSETSAAVSLLEQLEGRVQGAYRDYRAFAVDEREHARALRGLQEQVLVMTSSAPMVKAMAEDRVALAEAFIGKLEHVYGPMSRAQDRFTVPGDPKSPLIVECDFGGARVDVHLDLDGGYRIDAYGHASNAECARQGTAAAQEFASSTLVDDTRIDVANRSQPSVDTGKPSGEWQDVSERLRQVRSHL